MNKFLVNFVGNKNSKTKIYPQKKLLKKLQNHLPRRLFAQQTSQRLAPVRESNTKNFIVIYQQNSSPTLFLYQ
ncbi:MAG: hypothetical protein EAZ85_12440 [Bacteroidetes bacterium]|nr:MAG: hypothetical protein EAZ85_12440 [Bacteroidota bacterium]